jgi:hypothetical protein
MLAKYNRRELTASRKSIFWLSVIVLLLAALLRIYHLNLQGLWGDEGWSVEFSASSNPSIVTQRLVDDLHPPFYFILLSWWRQVAGDSELAMRLLTVFPAILTVALIDRIGRKLFSPMAGVLAGLVLALSDKHIMLAQEVRHYPFAFMLMALTTWVFFLWIDHPTRQRTMLYATLIILGVYTHYYTILVVVIQVIYALLALRPLRRVRQLCVIISLSLLAFIPWFFVAIYQLQIRPEGILHSMPLAWSTLEFLSIDFLGRPVILGGGLLTLGLLVFHFNHDERSQWQISLADLPRAWYVVVWFVLPIALSILIFPFVTVLTDRNMALLLLPIALLIGRGMTSFQPSGRLFLAVLLTVNGLTSLDSYFVHPPWRTLSQYVADNYPTGEPVIMDVAGGDKAMDYHLHQLLPEGTTIISLNQWRLRFGVNYLGVFNQLLDQNDGFWIAYWVNPDKPWDARQPLADFGYTLTATHHEYHLGNPIDLYHYDRLPDIDEQLATFNDQIRLHRVKTPFEVSAGDTLDVSLWWSTNTSQSISYSISVFLLDNTGISRAQGADGVPQNGQFPTDAWTVDEVIFDSHQISVPNDVTTGDYQLAIKVYNSNDGFILPVTTSNEQNTTEYFIVGTVHVR